MDPSPVTLDDFVMVFAQINLTSDEFRLDDKHWPEAIKKENEDNENNGVNIGPYKVNFKFRLTPEDTESVADGIAYDLPLWTDTNIVYDLYYQAVTGDPGKESAHGGAGRERVYLRHAQYVRQPRRQRLGKAGHQ